MQGPEIDVVLWLRGSATGTVASTEGKGRRDTKQTNKHEVCRKVPRYKADAEQDKKSHQSENCLIDDWT